MGGRPARAEAGRGERSRRRERENGPAPAKLTEELKAAFTDIGRRLPEVWDEDLLSRRKKKALLRCLIEKVVLRRIAPDTIQTRIVWKGGLSTTFEVSTTVGAFFDLSGAEEMERLVVEFFEEGKTDRQIARRLTELGHRSPQREARGPEHGADHPPQARADPGSEGEGRLARAPCPRPPHPPRGGPETRSAQALDVQPHLQRGHPGRQGRQDRTLPVPRRSGYNREVPRVEGRQGTQTPVLKGHQHARS